MVLNLLARNTGTQQLFKAQRYTDPVCQNKEAELLVLVYIWQEEEVCI